MVRVSEIRVKDRLWGSKYLSQNSYLKKMFRFRAKALKSEKSYHDNPTSFERIAAEIWIFYEISARFCYILAVRFERDTKRL